jgi:precorrin-6y C5,15-methyltransferase (decarboxylating), CbiE subunit/precorrin-6Y C5,15-methyltransferase (decarboxylating), CbiT subunit
MRLIVGGAGPGAPELFTQEFKAAAEAADMIITSRRLEPVMEGLNGNVSVMSVSETIDHIKAHSAEDATVMVAASGDTGFYSIASAISRSCPEGVLIDYICGVSSMQYFAARTQHSYEDMKLISLHGKAGSIVPYVCYNRHVFALTGGEVKAEDIVEELLYASMNDVTVWIGEDLSGDNERIVYGKPFELSELTFSDLAVVIVDNNDYVNPYQTLRDSDFIRGNTPMTKESVRSLAISQLEIRPDDVVWDIGAGTGAMTCAMALKAHESVVCAVEKDLTAIELINMNMLKLNIRNISLACGEAPSALDMFPAPDKVFIGGTSGNLRGIIERALAGNENAVIVVTAVTLETLSEAGKVMGELGLTAETVCANISAAQKLGKYNLMKAENPVYIIKGVRKIDQ